ncbi:ribonuclease H-like protein, partial [Cytidiella melzeri]
RRAPGTAVAREAVTIYTDGSCINNGDFNARAGAGVWYGLNDARNLSIRVPGPIQTNQVGEILAVQQAAARTPPFALLHIVSDSKYVIEGLTIHLQKWRDKGWIAVDNADLFRSAAYHLQKRSAVTTFEWVKGHSENEGNEGADALAGHGAQKTDEDPIDLSIPANWNITGTKLAVLSQALAYAGIRQGKTHQTRPTTEVNLDHVFHCVHDHLSGRQPTRAAIWKALRHRDITKKISDFLWKSMHGALKVGKYWNHIPHFEERAKCTICHDEESIEHILTECNAPECKQIWQLCQRVWLKKVPNLPWPGTRLGNILGAALIDLRTPDKKRLHGASRLYRIMITESAHLIWRMRCERRIDRQHLQHPEHSIPEIDRRWLAAMNSRILLDREMTRKKYGKKALNKTLVLRTWSGTLRNEHNLPTDWINTGFLVGMGPPLQHT